MSPTCQQKTNHPALSALNKSREWRLCRLLLKKTPSPQQRPTQKKNPKYAPVLDFLNYPYYYYFLQERERKEFICMALPKIKAIYGLGGGGYRALIRRIMSIDRGSTWINNNKKGGMTPAAVRDSFASDFVWAFCVLRFFVPCLRDIIYIL